MQLLAEEGLVMMDVSIIKLVQGRNKQGQEGFCMGDTMHRSLSFSKYNAGIDSSCTVTLKKE